MNSRRVLIGSLIGCGALLVIGILVVLAIALGASIGMQKAKDQAATVSDEGETTNTPKKAEGKGEEYIPIVMRVSGEQGTRFRCTHTNISKEGDLVQEEERGELAATPV